MVRLFNNVNNLERDFYKLLSAQSEKTLEGIKQLKLYMKTGLDEDGEKLVIYEKEGDELRRILIDELNKTFITPFEREDIFILSRSIDDMLDYSRSTYEEMQILGLQPTDETRSMVGLILEASEDINYSIVYLKNNPRVSAEHAVTAKKVENKIETEYRKCLVKLLENDDVKYILKMREVYRHLSNLADKIDYAADVIGHIVVKMG
ncbi:DUF47 family protein [Clostridium swellfunianum]|uniref:DUF47 domain-containing protein n=1 Tax=Clostridium swellfunianum TaxID=1367462 RepID=UPI00202DDFF2|nr:DUF47 family protein [Clostridium swellfunianum]MCM0650812.1 DUF47 family protein [Clostridium swellfunianum]